MGSPIPSLLRCLLRFSFSFLRLSLWVGAPIPAFPPRWQEIPVTRGGVSVRWGGVGCVRGWGPGGGAAEGLFLVVDGQQSCRQPPASGTAAHPVLSAASTPCRRVYRARGRRGRQCRAGKSLRSLVAQGRQEGLSQGRGGEIRFQNKRCLSFEPGRRVFGRVRTRQKCRHTLEMKVVPV